MQATQKKVKKALDDMIDEIDRGYLRDVQRRMFICSSHCCENLNVSREDVELCVDRCNKTMRNVQNVIESELSILQVCSYILDPNKNKYESRLQTLSNFRLSQKYGPDPAKYTESQMSTFTDELDRCVAICADDHVKLLPKIKERIIDSSKN